MSETVKSGKAIKLKKREYKGLDFATGAVLGILFFVVVYGVSTLNVTYDGWIYSGYIEEDVIQSYAGWMYYRNADWSWPLTVADNLGAPQGTSIIFTDSIPLVAIVCKLLSPLLPPVFQYFGWYNLLNCALQGGFSMLLLRRFSLGRVYSGVASVFFIVAPIFVERLFRHSALGSQWLILAALLCYFTARREEKFPAVGFWLLCAFCIGIHTYFMPVIYALLLAALLERVFREKKVLKPALFLLACFAGTIALGWVLGIFVGGAGHGVSEYGHYSMNLNAPVNPSSFDFYARDRVLGWSRVLPALPQRNGQYDGFNYLGLGVLLADAALLVYGIVRGVRAAVKKETEVWRRAWGFVKSHIWLLGVLLCLSLFAVSNTVVWGGRVLFTYWVPNIALRFFVLFRSSGRLFWVVTYLLTLAPLVFLGQRVRGNWKLAVVAVLLAVQLFDVSGTLAQKHRHFAAGPLVHEDVYTDEGWRFLMENYDEVLCLDDMFDYRLAAGIIRYNPQVRTNILLANQGDFAQVWAARDGLKAYIISGQPLEDGVLYLCTEGTFHEAMQGAHEDVRGYRVGEYYALGNPAPGCPLPEELPLQAVRAAQAA